jgi:hypothetical protein
MNSSTTGTLVVGVTAAVVAVITAIGQRLAARAASAGPASVADGYGQLVADLRADLDRTRDEVNRLRVEVAECERRHDEARERIAHLEQLVERRAINRNQS